MSSRILRLGMVVASVLGTASVSLASSITITLYTSTGPSTASTSITAYEDNAATAIQNGDNTLGTPGTPAYYQNLTNQPIYAGCLISTDASALHSWCGSAPPPAGYAGELGNQVFIGLSIIASGTTFSLNQIDWTGDFGNGTFAGLQFSNALIGVNGGTTYNSSNPGNDSTQITALYTSGPGFFCEFGTSGCPGSMPADLLNDSTNPSIAPGVYNETFSVVQSGDTVATNNVNSDLSGAPEPGSVALFAVGLATLAGLRKKLIR